MILFTDTVIADIDRFIAQKEPEQGGALLGGPDGNLISHFIFDKQAEVTSVTYRPSKQLIQAVQSMERADGLQFKGILHSHPGGMDKPSGQDHHAFASQLSHNLHMGRFIAPIVTRQSARHAKRPLKSHELAIGKHAKMSCFQALFCFDHKAEENQLLISRCDVAIVKLEAAVLHLETLIEASFQQRVEVCSDSLLINGLLHVVKSFKTPLFELQLFFPHNFPTVPPLALISKYQGKKLGLAQSLNLSWSMIDYSPEKLGERLLPLIRNIIKETDNATTRPQSFKRNSVCKPKKQRRHPYKSKETSVCR